MVFINPINLLLHKISCYSNVFVYNAALYRSTARRNVFFLLLLLSFTSTAQLVAQTVGVINGTKPYFTFNNNVNKADDVDGLMAISVPTIGILTPNTDKSTSANPIVFPLNRTFKDITSYIPTEYYPNITLTALISQLDTNGKSKYAKDADGDGNFIGEGTLNASWSVLLNNVETKITNLSSAPVSCSNNTLYKLTINAVGGQSGYLKLATQYGSPRENILGTSKSYTYYFKENPSSIKVCYALPNTESEDSISAQWVAGKGFSLQDINTPSSNFPTTGSNKLYFNLTVENTTNTVVWTYEQTPKHINDGGTSDIKLEPIANGKKTKIVLSGPSESTRPTQTFLPTTFIIKANNLPVYSFTIKKWFIAKTSLLQVNYQIARLNCNSMGYRIPLRSDYTNASNINSPPYNSQTGQNNGNGQFRDNIYTRKIGGGLFSEWGYTASSYYTGSDWQHKDYWTSEAYSSFFQYTIGSGYGYSGYSNPLIANSYNACVSP